MEIVNYTQDLLQRIQKIEPDNAIKIFGYLLFQYSIEEIMEYVSGTEEQIHSLIAEAKFYFTSSPKLKVPCQLHPYYRQAISLPFSSPSSIRIPALNQHTVNYQSPFQNLDHLPHKDSWVMEDQLCPPSPMGVDLPGNFCFPGFGFGSRSQSLPSCSYFYKGYCKHGQSCKSFHDDACTDSFNTMFGTGLKEFPIEDHMFSPGSLEKFEMEITELLRARGGVPVSLSLLPLLYQDMYGKALLPEGHLTESQRHGKVGLSLMKLLERLRNIRLVDRPHGQHCWVVLDEDASKYMEFMNERNDPGNSSSHQVYLTFPAESTFTDADVQNYFSQFGPVHDVRIPHQEKRMFGFVSFYHPQTVRQILEMGHPHIIRGSRVLVKPYIEKSRLVQRKYAEKLNDEIYSSLSFDIDNGLSPRQRSCEISQFHKMQPIEDCEPAVDLMRRQPYLRNGLEEPNFLQDRFNSLSIASQENTNDDDKTRQPCGNCNNQDSLMIQLPENPFASPRC